MPIFISLGVATQYLSNGRTSRQGLSSVSDKCVVTQMRDVQLKHVVGLVDLLQLQLVACTCKMAEGSSFWSHLSASQIACFKKILQDYLDDAEDFQLITDQSKN